MVSTNRAFAIVDAALDYRTARADMIAGNIANADTPFYRPRDIHFRDVLLQKRAETFNEESHTLELAQTQTAHMQPQKAAAKERATLYFRDGHAARNDGNSVDIDVETAEMSKNALMYNALISARKKSGMIFNAVIEASTKTG